MQRNWSLWDVAVCCTAITMMTGCLCSCFMKVATTCQKGKDVTIKVTSKRKKDRKHK